MHAHRSVFLTLCLASVVAGCGSDGFPPPAVGGLPGAADDEASTTGADPLGTTGFDTTGDAGSTGEPAATTRGPRPEPDSTSGGTGAGIGGGTDGGSTGGSTGDDGIIAEFGPPGTFGDDQREVDIVGSWGVPNLGNPLSWEAVLRVDAEGAFTWTEYDTTCGVVTNGQGFAWIEGSQLVLHFDAFSGRLPWRTEDVIGQEFAAPFRMKLGYAPMGTYLGLSAPSGWTTSASWAGRAYDRQNAGSGPEGLWVSESELWALAPFEPDPVLVVRDRYQADLQGDGTGLLTEQTTYWWPEIAVLPATYTSAPWADGNPGNSAGAATIASRPHAYDSLRLITFGQWDALRLAPELRCSAS